MRVSLLLGLVLAALLVPAVSAQALGVAYLDGKEVWVSTLDGQTKVRLSAGEGEWLAVAQGDGGQVVGVRNVAGRQGSFATFTVWQPDGTISDQGPLQTESGYSVYVEPLSLDITPDGGSMVYGYSNSRLDFSTFPSTFVLAEGTYVQTVKTRTLGIPFENADELWPTLGGARLVTSNQTQVSVQNPAGQPPYTNDFTPWLSVPAPFKVRTTDVAANGHVAAMELYEPNPGSGDNLQDRIGMFPLDQLGGSITPVDHDCFLPAQGGRASEPSLSQDGRQVAYVDGGGLKVAPVTDFATLVTDCVPTAVTTISATGRDPSIGPIDVAALAARGIIPPITPPVTPPGTTTTPPSTPGGSDTTGTAPSVSVPSSAKASGLAAGLSLAVTVPKAGRVSLALVISSKVLGLKGKAKSITVATGTGTAEKAGRLTVKLKAKRAYRSKLKKLKGKKVTLKITFGGRTTTKTIKLR